MEKKQRCIRVYISGKMTGLSWKQVLKNFSNAQEKVERFFKSKGYDKIVIFNPAFKTVNVVNGFDYEECMEMDFLMIKLSDAIFLMDNWYSSSGANRELHYALAHKKDVYKEDLLNVHKDKLYKVEIQ